MVTRKSWGQKPSQPRLGCSDSIFTGRKTSWDGPPPNFFFCAGEGRESGGGVADCSGSRGREREGCMVGLPAGRPGQEI